MDRLRRKFMQKSAMLGVVALGGISMPNMLFAKGGIDLWSAPALISLVVAVAIKQGEAKDIMELRYKEWSNPDQLRAGFASGEFVFGASPSNVGVNLYNRGIDVAMLNILTNGLNYIYAKDESLNDLKDLEGKKVIVPFKNDLPHIVLQALCKERNVDINKMKIEFVKTPPEAVMLFIAKDYDAVLAQEPMSSAMELMAMKNGKKVRRTIDLNQIWSDTFKDCPKIPQAGLIVRHDFYEQNSNFFDIFHSDLKDALKWILNNQTQAANFGSKYLPTPEPAILRAIPYGNFTVDRCKDISDNLDAFFDIIYELNPNLIGGKKPPKKLYL